MSPESKEMHWLRLCPPPGCHPSPPIIVTLLSAVLGRHLIVPGLDKDFQNNMSMGPNCAEVSVNERDWNCLFVNISSTCFETFGENKSENVLEMNISDFLFLKIKDIPLLRDGFRNYLLSD